MAIKADVKRWQDRRNELGGQAVNLLAADIGGTTSRLVWFTHGMQQPVRIVFEKSYPSSAFADAESLLRAFLAEGPEAGLPDRLCLALPGPVDGGRVQLTNLDWQVDALELSQKLRIGEVCFINDFQAAARGVESLGRSDLRVVIPGIPRLGGTRVITGPGTGLGVAWMQSDATGGWQVFPSEGGHADFAPADSGQCELLHWLAARHGVHVSWERLLSGAGLPALYSFLSGSDPAVEDHLDAAQIHARALGGEVLAERSIHFFTDLLAAWAGNLAVSWQPRGGLYLAGGMSIHLQDWIVTERFAQKAMAKGRMAALVGEMPLYLVTNPRLGVLGAMQYCTEGRTAPGCEHG